MNPAYEKASTMSRGWIVLALLLSVTGCAAPIRQEPGTSVTTSAGGAVTGTKRIANDGAGSLILPDGSRVAVDRAGGFTLPNGSYIAPDASGGLVLPNGARCVSDRARGYIC